VGRGVPLVHLSWAIEPLRAALGNYAVAVETHGGGGPTYVFQKELAHHGCVDFWKEIKDD